jgi:hypothetical protein
MVITTLTISLTPPLPPLLLLQLPRVVVLPLLLLLPLLLVVVAGMATTPAALRPLQHLLQLPLAADMGVVVGVGSGVAMAVG